jgi:hypothetical protein
MGTFFEKKAWRCETAGRLKKKVCRKLDKFNFLRTFAARKRKISFFEHTGKKQEA